MKDTAIRSIVKTISWRITGSSATLLISYFISDNWAIASTIAVSQMAVNTILYYVHERLWTTINWGMLD